MYYFRETNQIVTGSINVSSMLVMHARMAYVAMFRYYAHMHTHTHTHTHTHAYVCIIVKVNVDSQVKSNNYYRTEGGNGRE